MPKGHIDECLSLVSGLASDCRCASESKRYRKLAFISAILFTGEVVGGLWTGSLSLLSDAVHVLLDGAESAMNVYITKRVRMAEEDDKLDEAELRTIGAHVSAILIFIVSLFILHEGIERLSSSNELLAGWAIVIAVTGLVVNLIQMAIHTHAPDEHHNLTHTWQWLHIASDIAGSMCVVIGVSLTLLGYAWGDLGATLIIVLLIWYRVGRHFFSHFFCSRCT